MVRLKYLLLPIAGALSAFLSFVFAAPFVHSLTRPGLKDTDPVSHFTFGTTWSLVQHSVFGMLLCGSFCFLLEWGRRSPRQVLKATVLGMLFGAVTNSIADSGADYVGILFSKNAGSEAAAMTGELIGGMAWFFFVPAALSFTIAFAIGPTKQRMTRAFHATIRAAIFTFITRCATTIIASVKMGLAGTAQGNSISKLEASVPIFLADAIAVGIVLGLTMAISDRSSRAGSLRLIYGRNEFKDWSLDHMANRIGTSEVEIPIRGFQGVEPVHACIFRQGSQFLLDCQHAPGFLNGQPVMQAMLNHGDMIQLGEAQLVFYSKGAVQQTGQEWNHQMRIPVNPAQSPFQPQVPVQVPTHGAFPQQVGPAQPGHIQPIMLGVNPPAEPVPVMVPQVPPPSLQRFTLVDLAGKEFPLQIGVNTVGREIGNVVCFASNSTVSRSHAQIVIDTGLATLMDVGSANGTSVNGVPVAGPTLLNDGDAVTFGSASLKFRVFS